MDADIASAPLQERALAHGIKTYEGPPTPVANHLGQRGWEAFKVEQTADTANVYLAYHFRRSSDDRPADPPPAAGPSGAIVPPMPTAAMEDLGW